MFTFTDRPPSLRLGTKTAISNPPRGANVLTTSHTHPQNSPALFSGGDAEYYLTGGFPEQAVHSVTGVKWPMTNAKLIELGQPATTDLVTTVATQPQIMAPAAIEQHPFWMWLQGH